MTDLEHALRDALDARATAVTTGPAAYDAVVRRRERRRVRRWTTVAVATAATTAAVAAVVVLRPAPSQDAVRPTVAPPPGVLAAVTYPDRQLAFFDDPDDLDGYRALNPEGYQMWSVTTAGDGRFYTVGNMTIGGRGCGSRALLSRVDVDGINLRMSELPGENPVQGFVYYVSVSPDGRSLAYVINAPDPVRGCAARQEVRVRDVATGAERVWQRHPHASGDPGMLTISAPRWAADNRHLALGPGLEVLDTATAETWTPDYRDVVPVGGRDCEVTARAYRGRQGTEVVGVRCEHGDYTLSGVYEVTPEGAVTRRLFAMPVPDASVQAVTFDASGDHAFVTVSESELPYRWDPVGGLRPVDTGGEVLSQIAW